MEGLRRAAERAARTHAGSGALVFGGGKGTHRNDQRLTGRGRLTMSGTLLITTVSSLFLEFSVSIAGAKLRPFDGLVFAMLLHLLFARGLSIRLPRGLLLCGLFFLVHAASALTLGPGNFLREAIQVCVVFVFGIYVYNMVDANLLRRGLPILTAIILAVMAYNVLWHVTHGYITGWKRLDAPKMAFLFSTLLLTYYALKHRTEPGRGTLAATMMLPLMLPILLLSGERKALLFLVICGLLYLVRAKPFIRPAGWLAIFGALAIAMPLIPTLLAVPYVEQQVESIFAPVSSAELRIYSPSEYFAKSLSNAQRMFATNVGLELFFQSPITGVGTNAYQEIVRVRFSYLPPVMVNSIHSEFLRVLVENGVVGLIAFCLPLLRAVFFIVIFKAPNTVSVRWEGCLLLVVGSLILIAMESSGTKLLVPYMLVAILPDLARRASLEPRRQFEPSFSARMASRPSWQGGT